MSRSMATLHFTWLPLQATLPSHGSCWSWAPKSRPPTVCVEIAFLGAAYLIVTHLSCMHGQIVGKVTVPSPLQEGKTPMHVACCGSYDLDRLAKLLEVLRILISKKPDLDFRDDEGLAPIHIATMDGNIEAVQILLAAGANRALPDKVGRLRMQCCSLCAGLPTPSFPALWCTI